MDTRAVVLSWARGFVAGRSLECSSAAGSIVEEISESSVEDCLRAYYGLLDFVDGELDVRAAPVRVDLLARLGEVLERRVGEPSLVSLLLSKAYARLGDHVSAYRALYLGLSEIRWRAGMRFFAITPVLERQHEFLVAQAEALRPHLSRPSPNRQTRGVRLRTVQPSVVVLSFPRSGNTLVVQFLIDFLHAHNLEEFRNSAYRLYRHAFDPMDPHPLVIKSHAFDASYLDETVAYIVRDGRDSLISYAYYLEKKGDIEPVDRENFAAFVANHGESQFGSWTDHARRALRHCRTNPQFRIFKYEDLMQGPEGFLPLLDFLGRPPGNETDRLARCYARAGDVRTRTSSALWGYEAAIPETSFFHGWSRNRAGSNWRTTFTPEAREAFHLVGGTELLMELGYESDPDWWRET